MIAILVSHSALHCPRPNNRTAVRSTVFRFRRGAPMDRDTSRERVLNVDSRNSLGGLRLRRRLDLWPLRPSSLRAGKFSLTYPACSCVRGSGRRHLGLWSRLLQYYSRHRPMSARVTFRAAFFFPYSVGMFSNGLISVVHCDFSFLIPNLRPSREEGPQLMPDAPSRALRAAPTVAFPAQNGRRPPLDEESPILGGRGF
jgi:hypothetical protein